MSISPPAIHWQEQDQAHSAIWGGLSTAKAPSRIQVVDDSLSADQAFRLACEGCGLLWRGDFQNARQLLQAITRRADKRSSKAPQDFPAAFHHYRMEQAQRARILSSILLEFQPGFALPLRRAPEVNQACAQAYPAELATQRFIAPLRELQGVIGAFEWRKNGVPVAALEASIHPHYGVFSPVRSEYLDLVANAPLPAKCRSAFDIGTGSGVLAALLAKRGLSQIIATDNEPRALACAQENLQALGYAAQVQVQQADLFPDAQAQLLLCNPPWLPGKAASLLEHAIFDQESRMLRGFLAGALAHLAKGGQVWLILSDLAEHLQLRSRADLLSWIDQAGLQVLARDEIAPRHPRSKDEADAMYQARSREMTSLWRMVAKQA